MPHASDAYESPYVTSMNYTSQSFGRSPHHHTPSRSPPRHSPNRSPHRSPSRSPHRSPSRSPPRRSPHRARSDSDSGDSSGSSADDHINFLGGYDKFIANLELSDSEPDEKPKHAKQAKQAKHAKQPKHAKQATPDVVRDVVHDPWKQPRKIILPEAEAALAVQVPETKYEDQDPADYVDPDMFVSEDRPYKNLSSSAHAALAKLHKLAALGGNVEPRASPRRRTPARQTPARHARTINIQQPTPRTTPLAKHHDSDNHADDESPFIDTIQLADDQTQADPDDPRFEPLAEWDTRGSYSVGGQPRTTPSAARHTPHVTPRATPHASRRHTPVYDVRRHETPVSIRNPDLLNEDSSPFITATHEDLPSRPASPADLPSNPASPAASLGSPASPTAEDLPSNPDRQKHADRSSSPNFTGGFGGAFATFGGAW